MGLFKKMKEAVAGTEADDIKDGVLATGLITAMDASGTSITVGNYKYRMRTFALTVQPPDGTQYAAKSHQKILEWDMARIQPGATVCAVRVDPTDPQRVAIDWQTEPPGQITAPATPGEHTGDEIIATGEACTVVVAAFQDANMKHPRAGLPVYAFMLTVVPQSGDPYQVQLGIGVPPAALPRLFNGVQLPAKRIPGLAEDVMIDWDPVVAP
ncbi:MAG: hypothetical protein ACOYNI_06880 [Acidimicrobiia bacterium]